MSYTTFANSALTVSPTVRRNGTANATFTVTNTGTMAGTDIVPVYVAQPLSAVLVPTQRLVTWARVTLAPGQSTVVHVSFPTSTLAETQGDINASGPPTVQAGSYILQLDKNDTTPYDVDVSAPFSIS